MNLDEAKHIPISLVLKKFGAVTIQPINGGNSLDYVVRYLKQTGEDHTKLDALRWLNNMFRNELPCTPDSRPNVVALPGWRLCRTEELEDLALIRYAENRGISAELAHKHFIEAYVQDVTNGKRMYTLGFVNEDGGYALRNVFMKAHTGPKTVTFKRGEEPKPKAIHLFKDSFDFLSAVTRFPQYLSQHDSIILNYGTPVAAAFPYITGYGYQTLYSWMSNSSAGRNSTLSIRRFVCAEAGLGHKPMNGLYREFNDVNDWHIATIGNKTGR